MASDRPIETVATNPLGTLFSGGAILVAAIVGAVAGVALRSAVVGVGAAVVVLLGLLVLAVGREVRFHRDGFEYTGGLVGIWAESVDYDAVELVVRKTTFGDRVFGTETFTVVRPDEGNVDLWYLKDPDAAGRILAERVAPPEEQIATVSDRHRPDHLWYHWPDDTEPPGDPVVEDEELADTLDVDVGDLKLDAIDEAADLDDFGDLGDIGDVAGDIGADGGGDGGFDGGDGGGGE